MLAHSNVIAGRPGEAKPKELRSIMAHYRKEHERGAVHICVCESESVYSLHYRNKNMFIKPHSGIQSWFNIQILLKWDEDRVKAGVTLELRHAVLMVTVRLRL